MKKKIKVLEVLDCYYPKFDGPCLVVTSYANGFLNQNLADVKVCVPKFPKYKDNQRFEVFRTKSIPAPEGYTCAIPFVDLKLKKWLKENDFDLIHIHSPFSLCRFMAKYGKKHNIPTIFTFHTKYKEDFERTLSLKSSQNFMMKYIMRNINACDYVWTVSNGAADCLREYGYKKEISVIRNGTDLEYPENAEQLKKTINQKYDLKEDDFVFLSVGRVVENKNLILAVNALKKVNEKGYNFKYIIVGEGPYLDKLKEICQKAGLKDKVIFAGKIMDRSLLSAHYIRANLFVFPSTFDTASLAPIEAAALKLPTILNKGCPTAEIINNGVDGITAEENEDAWAKEMINVIENRQIISDMKENTFKDVFVTWDSVAKIVAKNYNKILEK